MIKETIPGYAALFCVIEAFLLGLTINVRSEAVKTFCRIMIIVCAVVAMCVT